ncbi:MAG: response regulator [bacterium]
MASKRILIVDDEQHISFILQNILEDAGYDTSTADNGITALEAIKHQKPDMIITDINMPHMDGLELLAIVRNMHPEIKNIIMTGSNNQSYYQKAKEWGVVYYFTKPLDFEKLRMKIDAVF